MILAQEGFWARRSHQLWNVDTSLDKIPESPGLV